MSEATENTRDDGAAGSVLNVQQRWISLFRRLLGLQGSPDGVRYVIVLTVTDTGCDWSVQQAGRVEK